MSAVVGASWRGTRETSSTDCSYDRYPKRPVLSSKMVEQLGPPELEWPSELAVVDGPNPGRATDIAVAFQCLRIGSIVGREDELVERARA